MNISRRDFLKKLGVTTAGAAVASFGCEPIWSVPRAVFDKVGGAPRIETWKNSICSLCPASCGIRTRLIDGIPVRILGNPVHPVNKGGICPMGESGMDLLFSPNRVTSPLERIGDRGGNKWRNISWDDAINLVVTRLQHMQQNNELHKLALLHGHGNGLVRDLFGQFMDSVGSSKLFNIHHQNSQLHAGFIQTSASRPIGVDFNKVEFLLNFGAELLDEGSNPVMFNQIYAEMRSRKLHKGHIVHIDSRLSRTAGKSHEWIPIQPGTMAALALGICSVLIKDKSYDHEFIRHNAFGFEDWTDENGELHQGFKSLVMHEYFPEKTAKITGIAPVKIVELAREFSASKTGFALAGGQATDSENGLYTMWAVDCLNALKGNYNNTGFIFESVQPPFKTIPEYSSNQSDRQAHPDDRLNYNEFDQFLNLLNSNSQLQIEALFFANADPLFHATQKDEIISAMMQIPFTVSFSPFIDETSMYADLILPDHTYLERQEIYHGLPLVAFSHLGVQQPVIEPVHRTMHTGDVFLRIAQKLGGPISESMPWSDYENYLKFRIQGVYESGAGTIFTKRMDETWLKYLKDRGWQYFGYDSLEAFWQVACENGGWWDPFPSNTDIVKTMGTKSGKYEFFSLTLMQSQFATDKLKGVHSSEHHKPYLPHYQPLSSGDEADKYDLHLLTFPLLTNPFGCSNISPMTQELFGVHTRNYWQSWIEMNPVTAADKGLKDGDLARIKSRNGELCAKVVLSPGVMPGLVYIPIGLGQNGHSPFKSRVGINPLEILTDDTDPLTGKQSLINTRVSITVLESKEIV